MILAKTPREKETDETIATIRKGTRELLKSEKRPAHSWSSTAT